MKNWQPPGIEPGASDLRVVGHGYCAAVKECADLGFVVN